MAIFTLHFLPERLQNPLDRFYYLWENFNVVLLCQLDAFGCLRVMIKEVFIYEDQKNSLRPPLRLDLAYNAANSFCGGKSRKCQHLDCWRH